jgi:hypothetical protein
MLLGYAIINLSTLAILNMFYPIGYENYPSPEFFTPERDSKNAGSACE